MKRLQTLYRHHRKKIEKSGDPEGIEPGPHWRWSNVITTILHSNVVTRITQKYILADVTKRRCLKTRVLDY